MRRIQLLLLTASVLASSSTLHAQALGANSNAPDGKADIALGYDFTRSNAPPGGAASFNLNGGFLSASYSWKYWLGVAGEAAITRASNISTLQQNLTLATYTVGPRVIMRQAHLGEFAQATFGIAHGSDSYFPQNGSYSTTASSYAFTIGGGLDYRLNQHWAVRAEAQYLHTALPNGVNSSQNHTMIGAALVYKFSDRAPKPVYVTPPPRDKRVSLTCSISVRDARPGEPIMITSIGRVPDGEQMNYLWTSDGGTVAPNGSMASLDTTGMVPGRYRITGRASLASDESIGASCEVPFRVVEAPKAAPPIVIHDAPMKADEAEFHMNVRDILFDYDKSALRPDSEQPLIDATTYLKSHPMLRILIGGYSDERGSSEYNIALGLKRANAVREALMAQGVSGDRLQVVSYGKGAQVCIAQDETCFQRNRRAAFLIQP